MMYKECAYSTCPQGRPRTGPRTPGLDFRPMFWAGSTETGPEIPRRTGELDVNVNLRGETQRPILEKEVDWGTRGMTAQFEPARAA